MRRKGKLHCWRRLRRLKRRESGRKVSGRILVWSYMVILFGIGLKVLKQSGILDAYQGLLLSLCKYGLPTEDLYEFSALSVLKHEKKLKAQKKRDLDERLKQRNVSKNLVTAANKPGGPRG